MISRNFLQKVTVAAAGVLIAVAGMPCVAMAVPPIRSGAEPESTISIRTEGGAVATSVENLFSGQLIVPQETVTAEITVKNDTAATLWSVLELARKHPVESLGDETISLNLRGREGEPLHIGNDCLDAARSTVKLVPGEAHTFDLSVSLSDLHGQAGQRAVTELEIHSFSTLDQNSDLCHMTLPATETSSNVPADPTISTNDSSLSLTGQGTLVPHMLGALAVLSVTAGGVLIARHRRKGNEKRAG